MESQRISVSGNQRASGIKKWLGTLVIAILAVPAFSQQVPPYTPDDPDADAPDRGVARISVVNGDVSVRRGDSGDLVAAAVNAPLVASDRLVTGDGRAEAQLDWANMIRLASETEVRFSELEYHRYQVQLAVGMITFRVLRDSDAQTEISTPTVSLHPNRKGIYRVLVQPDGSTEITVRDGDAEVFSPDGSQPLRSGQTMLVRGTASDSEFQIVRADPLDDWDRWNSDRDRELERTTSYQYVSPDVYGAEDLDRNGRWVNDPSYGNVWAPNVGADWAPYQQGRWTWIDYYGWTWVSDDPWGWAPYHYGRWYQASFGWAWYPGPRVSRQYWRPALVGFFGWGGSGIGNSFGFGFNNVGWVPLAPFEPYRPWYGRNYYGGGFRGINIVNNTNIVNVYRNARVRNGVIGMRASDFGRVGVNRGNFLRASQGDLVRAGSVRGQLPFTPSRESTQFSNRRVNTQNLPRSNAGGRFVSSRPPDQVNRIPFEQQRRMMEQGQRGGGFSGTNPGGNANPGSFGQGGRFGRPGDQRGNQGNNPGNNPGNDGRFQRFGNGGQPQNGPVTVTPGQNGASNPNVNSGGFRRFDQQPNRGFSRGDNSGSAQPGNVQNNGAPFAIPPTGGASVGTAPQRQQQPAVESRPVPQNFSEPSAVPDSFNRGRGGFGESRGFGNPQQPVRISPPIVNNRNDSNGARSFEPRGGGGFGGPRPGRTFSAPRNDGGGTPRGSGGAPRGSGGGGGNGGPRGGGGGNGRGGGRR